MAVTTLTDLTAEAALLDAEFALHRALEASAPPGALEAWARRWGEPAIEALRELQTAAQRRAGREMPWGA